MSIAVTKEREPSAALRAAPISPSQPLALPLPKQPASLALFWQSSVGKKYLMALTGILMFVFVLGHMLGNLQIFLGSEKLNAYAQALHSNAALLWGVRLVMLAAILTHAIAGLVLALEKKSARPIAYAEKSNIQGSLPSRTMIWSGVVIGLFLAYHLLHLTVGNVHPSFIDLQPFHNVVFGLRVVPAALAYIAAMVAIGFHLWHGLYSVFHSLGLRHPRYTPGVRAAAATVGTAIAVGDISIPLAVLVGLVG
jgi:succinate dehydrogenase / fumarate reductase cytochrome b subunit